MQRLRNALLPTFIVLLAASMVTAVLWDVSQSSIGNAMRQGIGSGQSGQALDSATPITAQASAQENIRAIASIVKVTILGLLKVTVFMGLPGALTVIVLNSMKRSNQQPGQSDNP